MGLGQTIVTRVVGVLENIVLWRGHSPFDMRLDGWICASNWISPSARSWIAASGVSVTDDAGSLGVRLARGKIWLVELTRASGILCAEPEFPVRARLVGGDDDAVALTDTDVKGIGIERFDWHEVGRNNLQHVLVDREVKVKISTAVDDSDKIFLALLELLLEVGTASVEATGAVDQNRVGRGRQGDERLVEGFVSRRVEPVGDDYRSPFFVPVIGVGAVNKKGSGNTLRVLRAIMAVIPRMAVLAQRKLVGKSVGFRDWALGDS